MLRMSGAKKKQEAAQARLAREAAERAAHERGKRLKLLAGAGVAIVAVVALVLALGLFKGDANENLTPENIEVDGAKVEVRGADETAALYQGIPQNGITLGDPDAPVTIVEVADLKCPACQAHAIETHPEVVKQLVRTGKANLQVDLVNFRDAAAGTTDGEAARNAAYNLAASNAFFPFVNMIFNNQGSEAETWATDRKLKAIATAAPGVDAAALNVTATPASKKLVGDAEKLATALEVQGTPSLYVKPRGTNEYTHVTNFNDLSEITAAVDTASKNAK
jgi:protein-disulfide isomerase